MDPDRAVLSRARLSRDARFDGKFYIAVLTTRIYCRPICPARASKEENVCYFPTAAAAAEAGFRPCLRCRPECSPGTPAWAGTSNTVSRALRLINETGLEDGGVEALAGHLGIGSRHLRRLFLKHLGATPRAVAQTRRLHFAKKLIDETGLNMTQIAIAAGFGSVRRFNAAIRTNYKRTPTQIRRTRRHIPEADNEYLFHLPFRPPFDWHGLLNFLARRATPGVEMVESGVYRRCISIDKHHGVIDVSLDEPTNSLAVRIVLGDACSLFTVIERIRSMFDLNADWPAIAYTLRKDPALKPLVDARPGRRLPGCWDGFELATQAILEHNCSVKTATALAGRLAKTFGQAFSGARGLKYLFPSPERLADADLIPVGVPRARAETIHSLARAVSSGALSFQRVIDTVDFRNRLRGIPGIGNWAAEYISMRALGEPDAFPAGDLLRSALKVENVHQLRRRAEQWRPWRAYAAVYLWDAATDRD